MQESVIFAPSRWGLGLNETLLPQHLKKLGYKTHAVGKVRIKNKVDIGTSARYKH